MRPTLTAALIASLCGAPAFAECWRVERFEGASLEAPRYAVQQDALTGQTVCFHGSYGVVSGSDLAFTQFGSSTLIGWAENGEGLEVVNVYQLDRENGVMTTTATRVGTRTVMPLLPDYTSAMTGRAIRLP